MNPARGSLSGLLACGCLNACAVGPNYVHPKLPTGAEAPLVSATPAVTAPAPVPDAWWELYHDPVLDQLLTQAFAANYDLQAAESNLAASRAILESARAQHYPSTEISAGGSYGRDPTTEEILEFTGHKPFTTWIFDSLIDVSYEVDLFGRVRRSVEEARANVGAVAAARDTLKVTVAAETSRAYAAICTIGEQLAVAEHSLEIVSREEEITVARHDAGASSDFDVVRAQALVAQVRTTIPPLRGQRRAALFELTALLGQTPSGAPQQVLSCTAPPHLSAPLPVGDGAVLLRRRPDVREAERQLAAATAGVGVATAELFPTVRLTAFYGGVGFKLSQIGTNDGLVWGAGPQITWQFPNLAGPLAALHRAKSNAAGSLSHFDSVVLTALKETEQALTTYTAELDHHSELVVFQDKSRRAFELARSQLQAGAVSSLDLLTAEENVVAADAQVAASDTAIVQDQIAVFKALGGGWQSP